MKICLIKNVHYCFILQNAFYILTTYSLTVMWKSFLKSSLKTLCSSGIEMTEGLAYCHNLKNDYILMLTLWQSNMI